MSPQLGALLLLSYPDSADKSKGDGLISVLFSCNTMKLMFLMLFGFFSTEHPLCPPHRAVEQMLCCQEGLCFSELCSLSCLTLSLHVEYTIASATCWQRKSSEALIGASKQVQLRGSFQLSILSHKQIKTLNEEQYIRKVVIQWKNYLLKSVTSLELRLE